jgi:hypothetical protein
MKNRLLLISAAAAALCFVSCKNEPKPETVKNVGASEFVGQWTIDVENEGVSWLEIRQDKGYLDGKLLWIAASVNPVSNVFIANNKLIVTQNNDVVRQRDEKDNPVKKQVVTTWLEIQKDGDNKIKGLRLSPKRDGSGVDTSSFTGTLLPPVGAAPDLSTVKFGTPITLFNGKDLSGWKLIDEKQKNGFTVVDGILVNDPAQAEGGQHVSYGNLRTEQEFGDFNLKLEVSVPEGSNSGIYLKGMYEVQVFDSYKKELDSHNMGAVYSRITPTVAAEKPAGQWQSLDITLCDRHATVLLNGVKIIDNQPVEGPTGGAIKSDVFAEGPIYLQGDHGKVSYRNIVLTPIVK